ncbi:DNA-directed RNA polymerase subunit omega [endosymbiont of Acanthamoeba sp. UWC8]|nr:DNA-directed RNA polymerase subunit omega [Candidatus Jidaibacter acanthamoeba]AIF81622.1 DNA-directed RNA polymerase subunit omega [endosymbiont of Acanthamoeba sp. UWC8]MBA8666909.1 DNA-directed RNA polymerase subunit omega [Holosporaceae bacterium 'Namur']
MARVTIEDCIERIKSRFELVVLAAQRAKEISSGARLLIERDNDKDAVVALREIASDAIDAETLRESVIKKYLTRSVVEEEDLPDSDDNLEIQQDMAKFTFQAKDVKGMSYEDEDLDE